MNPKAAYIPAIKLSNGEILSGDHHSILTLKAIRMGYKGALVSGNVNYDGKFCPMYPIDEEIIPDINNEFSAIKFANSCSKGQRDACERLSKGNDLLQIVVDRWDSLRRLPMVVAAKRLDNDHIYIDGAAHGTIISFHPDITFVESAADTHQLSIAGFLHDDGRFLNREQSAIVALKITGVLVNEKQMISGEEWIPHLKDEDDAIDFGHRMHLKGYAISRNRINVFTSLKKHLDHVKLLKKAIKEYENTTR